MRMLRLLPWTAALAGSSIAAQNVWTGAVSERWERAANWSRNAVPDPATDVIVPGNVTVNPVVTVAASCRSLTVEPGQVVVIRAAVPIEVHGDLAVLASSRGSARIAGVTGASLVVRGTRHAIPGGVEVPALFAPALDAEITLSGTMRSVTVRPTVSPCVVSITGSLSGTQIEDLLVDHPCRVELSEVRATSIAIQARGNLWVSGRVTCTTLRLVHEGYLKGDVDATLTVDELRVEQSSYFVGETPGQLRIRRRLHISSTNTFDPVRSVVVFDAFDDHGPGTVVVEVVGFPLPTLPTVRIDGGASVEFRPDPLSSQYGEGPNIRSLAVMNGSALAQFCRIHDVVVGGAGTLTVTAIPLTTLRHESELGRVQVLDGGHLVLGANTRLGTTEEPRIAGHLTVEAGGLVEVRPSLGSVPDTTLVVGSGATLELRGGQLDFAAGLGFHVAAGGSLVLEGTPAAPARIQGASSPIRLEGNISARSFLFSGMDGNGVVVTGTAVFAAPPLDFRGGLFRGGSTGVLLDLERSAATTLFDLDFESTQPAATRNVRVASPGPWITLVDARGNTAGPAFETDPNDRVSWRANATAITALAAVPGIRRNLVSFRSLTEETTAFRIAASGGPSVAPLPASGPQVYSVSHTPLTPGSRYTYSVQRQRLSPFAAEWQPLPGAAAATPHGADEGVTRFVGPNGYPSIAAALLGAPAGTIVFVEPGSYGGFSVTQPAHVVAGGDVTILGNILIDGVQQGSGEVVLDGLAIAPLFLVSVRDVTRPVILRDVESLAPTTTLSLYLARSPRVALQRVRNTGRTECFTATVHAWNSSFSRLELRQSARFVHASTAVASLGRDPTSVLTARSGPTARLEAPAAWPSGVPQTLGIQSGPPGGAFALLLAAGCDYLDLSPLLPFDMVLLVPPQSMTVLPPGSLDGSGNRTFSLPGPPDAGAVGHAVQLQLLTLEIATSQGRFGEGRQLQLLR